MCASLCPGSSGCDTNGCATICSGHGTCTTQGSCSCNSGWFGSGCGQGKAATAVREEAPRYAACCLGHRQNAQKTVKANSAMAMASAWRVLDVPAMLDGLVLAVTSSVLPALKESCALVSSRWDPPQFAFAPMTPCCSLLLGPFCSVLWCQGMAPATTKAHACVLLALVARIAPLRVRQQKAAPAVATCVYPIDPSLYLLLHACFGHAGTMR